MGCKNCDISKTGYQCFSCDGAIGMKLGEKQELLSIENKETAETGAVPAVGVERMVMRPWIVSVNVNGDDVVTIGTHSVGGVENCHEYTNEIRECARNLLAFIGEGA